MSRTIRNFFKTYRCGQCHPMMGGAVVTPLGYCPTHRKRPWTKQHDKRGTIRKHRNWRKNRVCCGGNMLWVNDLFWYERDVRLNDMP